MTWRKPYPTAKYNQNTPKRWTCVSICCAIENARGDFEFIGILESSIMLTIGPSTMQFYITRMRERNFDAAHCTRDATSRTIAISSGGGIKLSSRRALARVWWWNIHLWCSLTTGSPLASTSLELIRAFGDSLYDTSHKPIIINRWQSYYEYLAPAL